jgi:serine/threonine-protein phosphatase 2A regulatory subunit A
LEILARADETVVRE